MNVRFSAEQLKKIALVSMTIDHAAVGLIEQSGLASDAVWSLWGTAMRLVGRVAFPLFAFMIAEGAVHTGDRRRYALRLLLLAIISEIPFNLAAGETFSYPADQNTVFTLLLGLLAIWAGDLICGSGVEPSCKNREKVRNRDSSGRIEVERRPIPAGYERYVRVLAAVPFGLAAYCLKTDYDLLGVMLIVILYTLRTEPQLRTAVCGTLLFCMYMNFYGIAACVAIFLINRYNGEKGGVSGKFFYAFYPLHLLVIWGIKRVVGL